MQKKSEKMRNFILKDKSIHNFSILDLLRWCEFNGKLGKVCNYELVFVLNNFRIKRNIYYSNLVFYEMTLVVYESLRKIWCYQVLFICCNTVTKKYYF